MSNRDIDIFRRVQMSMWDSSAHSQSITGIQSVVSMCAKVAGQIDFPTLFAGFVFNFSNIFCDCDLEAITAAIFTDLRQAVGRAWEQTGWYEMIGRWVELCFLLSLGNGSGTDCDWKCACSIFGLAPN